MRSIKYPVNVMAALESLMRYVTVFIILVKQSLIFKRGPLKSSYFNPFASAKIKR